MWSWSKTSSVRRRQAREQRVRTVEPFRDRVGRVLIGRPFLAGVSLTILVCLIGLLGESRPRFGVGQHLPHPVYALVDFQVRDPLGTSKDRRAARAATRSYYGINNRAITVDKIRSDLMHVFEIAAASPTAEAYQEDMSKRSWPADAAAFARLRSLADLPDDRGRIQFQQWIVALPLESEYVVEPLRNEKRDPASTTNSLVLETLRPDGTLETLEIQHSHVVPRDNEKALRGSATDVARRFPAAELRPTVEAVVLQTFREEPMIRFDSERTTAMMREAEGTTAERMTTYEKGKPFLAPCELGSDERDLLFAHHDAYRQFLTQDSAESRWLRRVEWLHTTGTLSLAALLTLGLLTYAVVSHSRIFEVPSVTVAFCGLVVWTLLIARLMHLRWPNFPELALGPVLFGATVLTIVYPQRFAFGAACLLSVLVTCLVHGDLTFLLTAGCGSTATVFQLDEIRSRTKLITAGAVTALAVTIVIAAAGFADRHSVGFIATHALWGVAATMLSAFVTSGVLPFVERAFGIATSLTLLEWRDPTRPLLRLLAQEAPGTYNHSLTLGTLAEAACQAIGANSLLTQVGALFHDVGKSRKPEYFTENQEGRSSKHDHLAPSMSLLIILGHVKDGVELAREYKLPRVLHPFIEEHHGTTVVRYFHHVANERQPQIAVGRHDREVSEAEFRYAGPKPRSRESAVLMMCDSVEGAVRALAEPTVGRIECLVHQIITERLNDGQFDDCDITLKEIRKVEDSLVRTLTAVYHGRVPYPKSRKGLEEEPVLAQKVGG